MPRKPHRHGGAVHARGISSLKACVICGANDAGDGLCRVAGRGRPKDEALRDAIKGLGPGTWVATGTRLQKDGELGMASAMHQRLRIVLAPFHGVSTKRLDHCLSWFLWPEQARRSDADGLQTLSGQSACGFCKHTRRQMIDRPQPFWDYWQRQGAATSMLVSYVPNPVKRHGIPCPQGLSLPDLQGDPFRCRMPLEARPVPMRLCELPAHSHIRGYRAAAARTSVFRLGGRTAL